LVASTPHRERRQIALIDGAGRTAGFNGQLVRPPHAIVEGRNCIAAGNILAGEQVVPAMVAAFEKSVSQNLPDRLLLALAAGVAAGGEPVPLRSSALLVADELEFAYVDLRVDRSDDPVAALLSLWTEYSPRAREYMLRVIDPDSLP
jgi:uncharacterized Ntn-hydrolase superfamily protein